MAKMNEDTLKALVGMELRQSLGYSSSKLSASRLKAEYYYLGLPVGELSPPEIEGRSSVVSTDVRDTIEAMLPQLMVTFCGSDTVAEFEPQGPDDEQKANIATEYVNYLFFKKNNGHKIAYTWMKDALLQKNGIVKVWWDTRNEENKEEYRGLNDVELAQLLEDDEIEVIEQETYPDEEDAKHRQEALDQLQQQLDQALNAAQMGDQRAAQAVQMLQQQIEGIMAQPPKMQFDVVCKRVKTEGKVCIENVPPEEFLISRSAKDIATAKFVGHRVQRTVSELKSMGYKNVDQLTGEDVGQGMNMERIQRLSWNDENAYLSDEINTSDESQRRVWVIEAYVRCDYDGDGISELRKVTMAGNTILDNEEVDVCPFVSITPVPLPHTFFGLSIADLAMESQKTKTALLRSQLDNLYLSVNGRYFAVENQVNLDDLLTSRPGGVVRVKQAGMVGRLDQGSGDVGYSLQMMEYLQQDLESRTGFSRQSMANSAGGIDQVTATAANIVTNKADMRLDMIARNFAEGFTDLFRLILKLVCQYQNKAAMARLSGGWASIDPREWRNQFDVSINVGIGMGNKDQKIQHLMMLGQAQQQGLAIGLATPENLYQTAAELSKLLGYKNADKFFTDPAKGGGQQRPNPEMMKMQGQMQIEQAKAQAAKEIESFKAQLEDQKHQREIQRDIELAKQQQEFQAQQDALAKQLDAQVAEQKAQMEALEAERQREFDAWKTKLEAETKVLVAQIAAQSKAESADPAGMIEPVEPQESMVESQTQNALALAMQGFTEALNSMNRPKQILRGPDGRVNGIV